MENSLEILKALADGTRMKIINILLTHDLCVGALAKTLKLTEAAISQHLQILRKSGVVKGEKRGYFTHYYVDRNVLKGLALLFNEKASKNSTGKNNCNGIKSKDQQCRQEGE